MKRCNACDEEFKDKYSFCPVDATPLNSLAAAVVGGDANYYEQINSRAPDKETRVTGIVPFADREFRVTMIDTAALPKRLATEIRFMALQMRLGWPAAKQDPIGFGRRALLASRLHIGSALAAPNSMAGIVAALALVLTVAMIVLLSGRFSDDKGVDPGADANLDNEEVVQIVEFMPESKVNPQDRGVGLGSHGRVGLARGRGEGSAPKPRKATGGGGGGQNDPMPAQQGRPPQPSTIPAPIPKFPPVQKHVLPVAGLISILLCGRTCQCQSMVTRDRNRHHLQVDQATLAEWETQMAPALAREAARGLVRVRMATSAVDARDLRVAAA